MAAPGPTRDILPTDIVQVLATHGPVEVVTGTESEPVRRSVPVAPYEDCLYLLLKRGSPHQDGLLRSCRAEVYASEPSGEYRVSLQGRCRAAIPLSRQPMSSGIAAWLPDGAQPRDYLVAPFTTEQISFVRRERGQEVRYEGPSRAPSPPTWRRWVEAATGGFAMPMVALSVVLPWVWVTVQGPSLPWRPLALAMAIVVGLLFSGGSRLLLLSLGFRRWLESRAHERDAGPMVDAMVAPQPAAMVGRMSIAVGVLLAGLGAAGWGLEWGALAALSNGAFLVVPAWVVHLSSRSPEPI